MDEFEVDKIEAPEKAVSLTRWQVTELEVWFRDLPTGAVIRVRQEGDAIRANVDEDDLPDNYDGTVHVIVPVSEAAGETTAIRTLPDEWSPSEN